jgi:hypothetical protein
MTYPDMQSKSAHLYERAKNVLPWGSTRQAAFFKPYPIYANFGKGSRVTDVDGVERIEDRRSPSRAGWKTTIDRPADRSRGSPCGDDL